MTTSSPAVDRLHNLPAHPPSLIGRDAALVLLRHRTFEEGRALVPLTGAGSSGQTRLALALAASLLDVVSFPDGVWLADVTDELLSHCPKLRILATSGEPLRIATERVWLSAVDLMAYRWRSNRLRRGRESLRRIRSWPGSTLRVTPDWSLHLLETEAHRRFEALAVVRPELRPRCSRSGLDR